MADPKVSAPNDPMAGIASLAQLLGGTKTTQNAGNTSALESALAGLKGQDQQALLASIFQQAGAQIPGLQTGLSNAIGARSGGNSAVAAALQKLLSQTTITAQDQMLKQQTANLQTQGQIGASIAQATKGTTQSSGTDLGQAGKTMALLSLLSKSGLMDKNKDGSGGLSGLFSKLTSSDPAPVSNPSSSSMDSATPQINGGGFTNAAVPNLFSGGVTGNAQPDLSAMFADFSASGGGQVAEGYKPVAGDAYMPAFDTKSQAAAAGDAFMPAFDPSYDSTAIPDNYEALWFADGGIVHGRGKHTAAMEPDDTHAAMMEEEQGEAKANARFDAGFTANVFMDAFRKMLPAQGFADGGAVRAGGSRRSANPTVTLSPVQRMSASNGQPQSSRSSANIAPSVDFGGFLTDSLGGGSNYGNESSPTSSGTFSANPEAGRVAGTMANLNALSGITGGPAMPGNIMGAFAGIANAKTEREALGVMGIAAANAAAPGLGSAISFGMNPSLSAGINLAASFNPVSAMANLGLSLADKASIGQVVQNAMELANPNKMMTPQQQMTVSTEQGNPNSAGLTQQANAMAGDALSNLLGLTNSFGTGGDTGDIGGDPGPGDRGPGGSSGDAGAAAGGAGPAGPGGNGDLGAANGGAIDGPGTGTSDSIHARLSDGEFVMSADTVAALGEDFFNQLQAAFHTPVAQRKQRA